MNSVHLIQSNAASLPPPKSNVAILTELPAQVSSPPSPHCLDFKPPAPNRLIHPFSSCPATEPKAWFVDLLFSRWDTYRERLNECRNKPDSDSVHELRVAIRRLISQLVLVSEILPASGAEKVRKILKPQLESLGSLRDTHVQQIILGRQVARFLMLAHILGRLERRERSQLRRASRLVHHFKTKKAENWFHHIRKVLQRQVDSPPARQEISQIAIRSVNVAFAEVIRRWLLIDPLDSRTIHHTRVAFKKFRYLVEGLPGEVSGLSKRELRAMALYQRKMGKIQDLEVVQGCLNEFLQEHGLAGTRSKQFCSYLQQCRNRALRSFGKSAEKVFTFWQLPQSLGRGASAQARTTARLAR